MVKTPGWFHFSAAAVACSQALAVSLSLLKTGLPAAARKSECARGTYTFTYTVSQFMNLRSFISKHL